MGLYWLSYPPLSNSPGMAVVNQFSSQRATSCYHSEMSQACCRCKTLFEAVIQLRAITNSTLIWLKGEIMISRLVVEGRTNKFRQNIVAMFHEMMSGNCRSVNAESSLKHPLTFSLNTSCFWYWMSTLDQNQQMDDRYGRVQHESDSKDTGMLHMTV